MPIRKVYRKVYRKKAVPRKGYATKKYYNRRANKMAKFTNLRKDLYFFKRKRIGTQYDLTAQPTGVIQFQLNDLVNSTEFTTLYDRYMITGVQVGFRLIYSPDSTGNVASSQYPNLYIKKDYDDNLTASTTDIIQSNKAKRVVLYPNRLYKMFVRPATLAYSKDSAGNSKTRPEWRKWQDCATTDITYLGIKWAIDTMGQALPANTRHLQIEYTYYLAFKDTR